ncbi:MAG: DNA repair exonuclease [Deltaproteobacteria bacterium]|nr:DNA repair exonuclease [Deltaproteobacteria bacterium]
MKNFFRFIHTADIHLDSPLKGLEAHEDAPVDEIRGATRRAFDNLIDLAIDEEVDFVLIAGDLYDGDWKDYNTGLFFVDRMGKLNRAGIRVFIVSGNHDAASRITKTMPLPDNVALFSSRKPESVFLNDIGVAIHGQSYRNRVVTENIAAQYPLQNSGYFNIGLLHTALTGRDGHEPYAPCTVDDLLSKGYDYWALGHIHTREIISENPWIVFPGNIQGRHIRETGPKGASLVTVDDGLVTAVEHRNLDVLRWAVCRVDLSGCETMDAVYGQVRTAMEKEQSAADGRTLALRLHLEGRCPLHAELHSNDDDETKKFSGIAAAMGDVWLEKVKLHTIRKKSLEEIVGEDTPLVGLLQAIEGLSFGNNSLIDIVPDIAGLKTKLPPELMDENRLPAESPGQLAGLREDVRELLIARLIRHGGEA